MAIDRDATIAWMKAFAEAMTEQRQELGRLDTAVGDGDHGTNMQRGMAKAVEKLEGDPPADPGAVLKAVAMTLVSTVGGAAGPLYGTLLLQMGNALAGAETVDQGTFAAAWLAGVEGVRSRGKAELGDKTMLDALAPAVDALRDADDLDAGLAAAVQGAREGMEATVALQARKGRASYLGERSIGHQDPGATSVTLLVAAAAAALDGVAG
jgi:phosphoenolpyruvate---glycerone phosphotransferase subunit DhaL